MVRPDRFFFALFSLCRYSLSIGLLERPLVIGFVWGLCTGDYETSLKISIFFELFWLDVIPVGTFIPPHLAASTFAALALHTRFAVTEPAVALIVVLLSIPLAWLGMRLEYFFRDLQNRDFNRLLHWVRHPETKHGAPERLVLRSVVRTAVYSWVAFTLILWALEGILGQLLSHWGPRLLSLPVTWPQLWLAASLGGLMSLRLKKAYGVLFTGVFLVGIFLWAGVL